MLIQSDVDLQPFNTLAIPCKTRYYAAIDCLLTLQTLLTELDNPNYPMLVLGGGSNVLFSQDYPGIVIHNRIRGIEKTREDASHVWVTAQAGEPWHPFVEYCLKQGYFGLENLALIPGTVGAAPIQNIGAYGVELEQYIASVTAVAMQTGEHRTFLHTDCEFSYRSSVFKHALKDQYIITAVTFKLRKQPALMLDYGAIRSYLADAQIDQPTPLDVCHAVCAIRRSKLPDPSQIPNVGSFFKNPLVSIDQLNMLKEQHNHIPFHEQPNQQFKLSAAWLIETAGLKGFTQNRVSTYDKHALVIINPNHQSGETIIAFAKHIQAEVQKKFGVLLEPEVNYV